MMPAFGALITRAAVWGKMKAARGGARGGRDAPMSKRKTIGRDRPTDFLSRDGLVLHGTVRTVPDYAAAGALLVHGLTGDREENGLYTDLAGRLAGTGVQSLRFDMRGHGRTGGRYEDMTMSGVVGDIGAAYAHLAKGLPRGAPAFVVGSSFGGGMSVCWAAATAVPGEPGAHTRNASDPLIRPARLAGIVLFNPLLDCRKRFLLDKPYWGPAGPSDEAIGTLAYRGWLEHDGGFHIGRGLYNELSLVRPQDRVAHVDVPLLTVHGDADSVAPHGISRECTGTAPHSEFATIAGADHGFVHPDDNGDGGHHDTRRLRDEAMARAAAWMAARA